MKKLILSGILGAAVLSSCATVQKGAVQQKQQKEYLGLKGDWQIIRVNYDKSYKVSPFDSGADAQCFVGSVWHLVPNNNTGSYTVNGSGTCPSISQAISFHVENGNEFKFKDVGNGIKAKKVTAGYSLNLLSQTADTFTLEQNVAYGSDLVKINYIFQKIK